MTESVANQGEINITKFPFIDALRGLAIFGVLINHGGNCLSPWLGKYVEMARVQGAQGVQLFFVVSALTLFMSLENRKKEKKPYTNFFIRRFFRIAPLFYVAILIYLLLGPGIFGVSIANLISLVTFTNYINPYWGNNIVPGGWCIAVEMPFYLTLPFLFKYIKNLKVAIVTTVSLAVVAQAIRALLVGYPLIKDLDLWKFWLNSFLPSEMPVFLLGIVVYFLIVKYNKIKSDVNRSQSMGNYILFGSLAFLFAMIFLKPITNHFLFSIFFAGITFALFIHPSKLFVNKFFIFLGKISFSVYLSRPAITDFIVKFNLYNVLPNYPILSYLVGLAVLFSGAILVSFLTYKFIEKPGIAWGRKIISKLELKSYAN